MTTVGARRSSNTFEEKPSAGKFWSVLQGHSTTPQLRGCKSTVDEHSQETCKNYWHKLAKVHNSNYKLIIISKLSPMIIASFAKSNTLGN
jgi:hypothetical protein